MSVATAGRRYKSSIDNFFNKLGNFRWSSFLFSNVSSFLRLSHQLYEVFGRSFLQLFIFSEAESVPFIKPDGF